MKSLQDEARKRARLRIQALAVKGIGMEALGIAIQILGGLIAASIFCFISEAHRATSGHCAICVLSCRGITWPAKLRSLVACSSCGVLGT